MSRPTLTNDVAPAQAGAQSLAPINWVPACAGTTYLKSS